MGKGREARREAYRISRQALQVSEIPEAELEDEANRFRLWSEKTSKPLALLKPREKMWYTRQESSCTLARILPA